MTTKPFEYSYQECLACGNCNGYLEFDNRYIVKCAAFDDNETHVFKDTKDKCDDWKPNKFNKAGELVE